MIENLKIRVATVALWLLWKLCVILATIAGVVIGVALIIAFVQFVDQVRGIIA